MSPVALALVLVAAVAHAAWNLASRGVRADASVFVFAYATWSAALWLPVAAVVWALDPQRPTWAWLLAPVVSGALHNVYGTVLQRGYHSGDLNLVYPVARGVGPMLTLVVAVSVLGERPSLLGGLGAVIIVAGIVVIAFPAAGLPRDGLRRSVGWGAATGATIAAYTLWDAYAVTDLRVPPLSYFALNLVAQVLTLAPWTLRRLPAVRAVWREQRGPTATVAVLSPLAYVLVLEAMRMAPVALVASTRETSIVIGSLLGTRLFGEPGGRRRGLGAVIVLGGIALVAL
ncbi:hypothetical protein D9V37_08535 [Nocardioides mangrovicus]|uniref:EamA domain-containing protein n=1 Tax=Nocardioides mangrovicus TaxID=2478913 RepID=A0A3L8P3S6_9ACTN|nr:DMT family transporter [Nocardioides mangrovicus]RLV49915.1 hypothetical protein D9V37_08535 [Nocardioides mangrovicus]